MHIDTREDLFELAPTPSDLEIWISYYGVIPTKDEQSVVR